jgi:hypothetical protein
MELIFSPAAVKVLPRLPAKDAAALMAKLQQVAANPAGQHPWAKKPTGYPGFRIR